MTTFDDLMSFSRRMPEVFSEAWQALLAYSGRDTDPYLAPKFTNDLLCLGLTKADISVISEHVRSRYPGTPSFECCAYAVVEFVKCGASSEDAVMLLDQCIYLTMDRDIDWEHAVAAICRTWVLR